MNIGLGKSNILTVKKENTNKILNTYFNLNKTYLSNFCVSDIQVKDMGCNEQNSYFIKCNNGKIKITNETYYKNMCLLNPDIGVIPFEYVFDYMLFRFLQMLERIERNVIIRK